MRFLVMGVMATVLATSCAWSSTNGAAVEVAMSPHRDGACSGRFVAYDLAHTTSGAQSTTTLFDGTGAGVAIEDLDADGDLDIVLANLSGWTTVQWNQGNLAFESDEVVRGRFRQPAPVDVTGDGRLDLILTTGVGRPVVLVGGPDGFIPGSASGLEEIAYSIAWGDAGGDGDLDLATGSYNAELTAQRDVSSVMGGESGVTFYERTDDGLVPEKMSDLAQALVVRFHDVDGDGRVDLMAGNDLATPDDLWVATDDGWERREMFPKTTFSTMSLDAADIDNDGDYEVYATDMHPMSDDPETLQAWEPVMEDMAAMPVVDDIQSMENVLLAPEGERFESIATELGIPHTGWSWSGVFGDLDQDGFVDLYVVNGMESPAMFPNLPGGALVEENQAFRNLSGAGFVAAPEWRLADQAGGRGMAMGDLDGDGDLDIVVNNLNAPARLFENQVCGGYSITVELAWRGLDNRKAIGSRIDLATPEGSLTRRVEANRGYLASGPASVHFGLGDEPVQSITVTWPDGETSSVEGVEPNSHVVITR